MESADIKKLKKHTLLAILILTLGVLVMIYGIVVEDEPTAVALLLITSGAVWLFITRLRLRSRTKLNEQKISN